MCVYDFDWQTSLNECRLLELQTPGTFLESEYKMNTTLQLNLCSRVRDFDLLLLLMLYVDLNFDWGGGGGGLLNKQGGLL